jgi:hypothetical protein
MFCPVCHETLDAKFTRGGQHYPAGVMVFCPDDSRHFRGFINDPKWLREAEELGDPRALIGTVIEEWG